MKFCKCAESAFQSFPTFWTLTAIQIEFALEMPVLRKCKLIFGKIESPEENDF